VEDELQFQVDGSRKANETADALYASGRMWVIGILLACVALGMTLAICIARIVTNPVKQLSAIAESIAAGDMEQQINIHTKEEMGALAGSFRQLQDAVKNLIVETKSVAQAAQSGDLKKRGDASNFQGAYRDLLTGFNETLDAVLEPINEAADVLDKVADRDLTARVKGNYQGDHAKIKDALNTAIENLEEALGQAAVGAEQVSAAATQISNGSQALAQGASEQASSLEEISSSLEEMASMTKQNAENSNQGKALAAQSQESAERGDEAMKRMADAIGKIKSSSDATAKIVKTIDEIAFQTNLLALNAAVEAARAGEAGKGFAVVAEEVRNLAQRSAEAAKDTANMIEESVANAEGGVQITNEVASLLSEIADGARKVNDLVAEIAVASKEQSTGIEQVNLAVTQLDKVTQQNAANSEESASAAEELNSQSVTLSQTVQQFKIGVTEAKSAANAPAAKPQAKEAPTVSSPKKNGAAPKRELVGAGTNGHARNGKANRILPLDEGDFAGF
jgi:methyl-accepting chemotaxis protein